MVDEFGREQNPEDLEGLVQTRTRRLQALALATVVGTLGGLGLFAATNLLVVRGLLGGKVTFAQALYKGSDEVGPTLSLLDQFFPGYLPTVLGSLIGFVYMFVLGFAVTYFGARIYNAVADLRGKP